MRIGREQRIDLFALVGFSPYQLHTTLCSHLKNSEHKKKSMFVLEIGAISTGQEVFWTKWPVVRTCLLDLSAWLVGSKPAAFSSCLMVTC